MLLLLLLLMLLLILILIFLRNVLLLVRRRLLALRDLIVGIIKGIRIWSGLAGVGRSMLTQGGGGRGRKVHTGLVLVIVGGVVWGRRVLSVFALGLGVWLASRAVLLQDRIWQVGLR